MGTTASRRRRVLPRRLAFVNTSLAFVTLMASAGAPATFYGTYTVKFAISEADITGSYAAYFVAAAASMLFGGQISDTVGRRPAAVVTILAAIVGCVVLAGLDSAGDLVLGRAVQGLVVGLSMTSVGAFVVDLRKPGTSFLASAVAGVTPTVGVGLGAVLAGVWIESWPLHFGKVFLVFAVLLAVGLVGVILSGETVSQANVRVGIRQLGRAVRPKVAVPTHKRQMFVGVVATFVASWTLGAFYQSLGPLVAAQQLDDDSHVFAGLVVASVLAVTAFGGPLVRRLPPRLGATIGLAVLVLATGGVLMSLSTQQTAAFFVASVLGGVGFGAATTGSMRALLDGTNQDEVAGLLSAVYLVSYVCAAIPAFVGGRMVAGYGLLNVTFGYGFLICALSTLAVLLGLTKRTANKGASTTRPVLGGQAGTQA